MLIAGFSFAWMNVCVKYIGHIPVFEIILARAIITIVISYVTLKRRRIYPWGVNHKFLIARGIFGGCGLICYFYTLQQMQLANAIVIHYLSPIFTTLIALLFLKEKVRYIQWLSFAITFTGVILVKGFANVNTFDFIVGVAGAFFTGLAYNAIRNMKGKEDADVIIFYHPLISFPIVLIFFLISPQQFVMPKGTDWLFLIGTGIFTQIGQYYITRAYQADTAARVSSVSYIGLIWGVLFGKFIFKDSYTLDILFGMSIVVMGIIFNLNALRFTQKLKEIKAYLLGIGD